MSPPPANPKIYHITHVDNLPAIVQAKGLWSDAKRIELKLDTSVVGMSRIKKRRLEERTVSCWPDTMVGSYVPFYFCPRSIMLYILYRSNHRDVDYRDGQGPIIHLQADLNATIRWATSKNIKWAFTPTNAGAAYTDFYNTPNELDQIDWDAVRNRDFRSPSVKEGKQAEFLVQNWFPWELVESVGVFDQNRLDLVTRTLVTSEHQPTVQVENGWYF